ncbi:hypothetical protein Dsin_032942 [Dipteronia sinensis]|uniref:Uncharacterized protein n=1 Tax=Dipteronia sinensis TaxID=43782 RepID=A0AAD9Z8S3_9ROSI|nr:hypothetical protein Dsin_032942 [Dipteronia sinensis]
MFSYVLPIVSKSVWVKGNCNKLKVSIAQKELGITWDVDLYGELLKIEGGKERMTAYFNKTGWLEKAKAPKSEAERKRNS